MNKAIFLDRDGTLNVEKEYLYKIEDFEFLPGVMDALKLLQGSGYLLFILTNQSGIARGYYTEEDFISLNDWMLGELMRNGIRISGVYYCPHLTDAKIEKYRKKCICRKPQLGMFEQAVAEHGIDLSGSYAIGDKIRDCAICGETECRGFLISDNEERGVIEKVKKGGYRNVEYAHDLFECAKRIAAMEG